MIPITRRALLSSLASGGLASALPGCAAPSPRAPGAAQSRPLELDAASPFPSDFAWGVATSAYQIEGAAAEDGRGPSIWDAFCKQPGATFEGQTGDVACDHYHRHAQDVALMRSLGARSYRFSISWSRVLPEGRGVINERGLDFYARLIDELLGAGITPFPTLFHWDYPSALFARGGWLERDSADWFADYARLVVQRFGDRVRRWATINEPNVHVLLGHVLGLHAPGLKLPPERAFTAAHNVMRAHGRAIQAIRSVERPTTPLELGCAFGFVGYHPATPGPDDLSAAAELTFAATDGPLGRPAWWLDPMLRGAYPADGLSVHAAHLPRGFEADLTEIRQPQDFLGLNIYWSDPARRAADGRPEALKFPSGYPRAATDWQPIVPQALYYGPRFAHGRYQLPIYITESGLSVRDQLFLDGSIHDAQRVDYIQRVLVQLAAALREGVPVRGYFHWSLLDNFEWADAYKQRFGLVYVDFPSQRRVPKDSFAFYRDIIQTNGARALAATSVTSDDLTP
ncbi:MAG TPA: GH1 family beta-glucosidase [Polyangiaceae bacterium]|nr:GH1 family beta-glucosidase [Polyangiaceae bacterium]